VENAFKVIGFHQAAIQGQLGRRLPNWPKETAEQIQQKPGKLQEGLAKLQQLLQNTKRELIKASLPEKLNEIEKLDSARRELINSRKYTPEEMLRLDNEEQKLIKEGIPNKFSKINDLENFTRNCRNITHAFREEFNSIAASWPLNQLRNLAINSDDWWTEWNLDALFRFAMEHNEPKRPPDPKVPHQIQSADMPPSEPAEEEGNKVPPATDSATGTSTTTTTTTNTTTTTMTTMTTTSTAMPSTATTTATTTTATSMSLSRLQKQLGLLSTERDRLKEIKNNLEENKEHLLRESMTEGGMDPQGNKQYFVQDLKGNWKWLRKTQLNDRIRSVDQEIQVKENKIAEIDRQITDLTEQIKNLSKLKQPHTSDGRPLRADEIQDKKRELEALKKAKPNDNGFGYFKMESEGSVAGLSEEELYARINGIEEQLGMRKSAKPRDKWAHDLDALSKAVRQQLIIDSTGGTPRYKVQLLQEPEQLLTSEEIWNKTQDIKKKQQLYAQPLPEQEQKERKQQRYTKLLERLDHLEQRREYLEAVTRLGGKIVDPFGPHMYEVKDEQGQGHTLRKITKAALDLEMNQLHQQIDNIKESIALLDSLEKELKYFLNVAKEEGNTDPTGRPNMYQVKDPAVEGQLLWMSKQELDGHIDQLDKNIDELRQKINNFRL
jgi:hypothetical protein